MRFTFTSGNPANRGVLTPSNKLLYTISSTKFATSTTITRPSDVPGEDKDIQLASIEFRTWEKDRIVLRGQTMLVKDWMKRTGLGRLTHYTFTATSGRTYRWSIELGAYKLRPLDGGLVVAERPKLIGSGLYLRRETLDVSDEVLQDLVDIVASFVYISVRRLKQRIASTAALT
ncbi:hypothetical protein PENSPDRAFT_658542 [Peniophora sp. CONT]|nr:hypothetical protein PENSPDRAFT_658542 [Peniophora sp. CONT]